MIDSVDQLCQAAKSLGNGFASAEAILKLILDAKTKDVNVLFREMISHARHLTKNYEPALQLERWARISGITGQDSDFRHAVELLPKISNRCARACAKKLIVVAYINSGRLDDARKFAAIIKSAFWSAESWVEIAKKSGLASDLGHAQKCCQGVTDPYAIEEIQAQIRALACA